MPVSWPTVIWSLVAGAAITMALPYLVIGLRDRGTRVYLFFALAGFAVAWLAAAELSVMRALTPSDAGRALQIGVVPTFILVVAIVGFVWFYFGTGRLWLAWVAIGLRAVALLVNFVRPPNQMFSEITGLRSFSFLGETVIMPVGPRNPWIIFAYASSVFLLAFLVDASLRLWRRRTPDSRRRAAMVGGSIVFFVIVAQGAAILVNSGSINFPYFVSIPSMAIVAALGLELTYDAIRAARLTRELQVSEARMSLAAESARLAMWEWDMARDDMWMTDESRAFFGFKPGERVDYESLAGRVHPDDRATRTAAIKRARETDGAYEAEYRLVLPDGSVRWVAARGRSPQVNGGPPPRILGVSIDITRQKQAEAESRQQRDALSHLSRVSLLGEVATSLAHELNQPLTAMVTNADAAQRFLERGPMKVEDLREILADIAADGHRASDVIRGIKGMARKAASVRTAVDLNDVVGGVLRLVRSDAATHGCTLATDFAADLPAVNGDVVQLQQVLLNLVVNALDAIRQTPATPRRVEISSRLVGPETVEVSVRDTGPGLPAGDPARVFERFYSTKPEGMGMGLAIARSIIEDHGGTLDAENVATEAVRSKGYLPSESRGARFWFRLPAQTRIAAAKEATT